MARAMREADGAADERAEHPGDRGLAQPAFEQDDERRQRERETDVRAETDRQRLEERGGIRDCGDEQDRASANQAIGPVHESSPPYNRMKRTLGGTASGQPYHRDER